MVQDQLVDVAGGTEPFLNRKHKESDAYTCQFEGTKRAHSQMSWLLKRGDGWLLERGRTTQDTQRYQLRRALVQTVEATTGAACGGLKQRQGTCWLLGNSGLAG